MSPEKVKHLYNMLIEEIFNLNLNCKDLNIFHTNLIFKSSPVTNKDKSGLPFKLYWKNEFIGELLINYNQNNEIIKKDLVILIDEKCYNLEDFLINWIGEDVYHYTLEKLFFNKET